MVESTSHAFQDYYADKASYCYGCGRLNEHGLHIRSFWDGEESVCDFQPHPWHLAVPGYVYGGLIASLIDCHSTGTAAAAAHRAAGRPMDVEPHLRFLTGSLHVDYLKPTPLGPVLRLRGRVTEQTARKVVVAVTLTAEDVVCARGEVVAVLAPEAFMATIPDAPTSPD